MFLDKIFLLLTSAVIIKADLTLLDPFNMNNRFQDVKKYDYTKFRIIKTINKNEVLSMLPRSGPTIIEDLRAALYCKSYTSCDTCLRSELYNCGWCHDYGCTINHRNLCPEAQNDWSIQQIIKNRPFCTSLIQDQAYTSVQNGKITIRSKIQIADPAIFHHNLMCLIVISEVNKLVILPGKLIKDIVYCGPFVKPNIQFLRGTFQLHWGGAAPESGRIPMIMYTCSRLGKGCGSCARIPALLGCGWCEQVDLCLPHQQCSGHWIRSDILECFTINEKRRKYLAYNVNDSPKEDSTKLEHNFFQYPVLKYVIPNSEHDSYVIG